MLITLLTQNPKLFIAYLTALIVAITIHEFSHALAADSFGDPTARNQGRLSMNPFDHLDPVGTIFLLIAGFGWGKPVQFDASNFKNPKFDEVVVSLAGPFSNLILAILFTLLIRFFHFSDSINVFFFIIIIMNLTLMTFNLLPIPPLDGSHILKIFLPNAMYNLLEQLGLYFLIIIVLISSYVPIISMVINFVVNIFFMIFGVNATNIWNLVGQG